MTDKTFGTQPADERIIQKMIDMGDGTYALQTVSHPPFDLLTDGGVGEYRRLRVDVGQTGFFAGREFRTFLEYAIPTGQTLVIKIVANCDTIVQSIINELHLAEIKFELRVGGTEGGTFATPLPVMKTNMTSTVSAYGSRVTLNTGGTHTGGTLLDTFKSISGANVNKSVSQSVNEDSPVGLSAGTYYIKLINTDGATADGILKLRWEERI